VYARLRCDACACGERRREYPSVRTSKRRMPRALRVQRTREARAASSNNFSRGSGRAARAPAARRIHAAAIGFPNELARHPGREWAHVRVLGVACHGRLCHIHVPVSPWRIIQRGSPELPDWGSAQCACLANHTSRSHAPRETLRNG